MRAAMSIASKKGRGKSKSCPSAACEGAAHATWDKRRNASAKQPPPKTSRCDSESIPIRSQRGTDRRQLCRRKRRIHRHRTRTRLECGHRDQPQPVCTHDARGEPSADAAYPRRRVPGISIASQSSRRNLSNRATYRRSRKSSLTMRQSSINPGVHQHQAQ